MKTRAKLMYGITAGNNREPGVREGRRALSVESTEPDKSVSRIRREVNSPEVPGSPVESAAYIERIITPLLLKLRSRVGSEAQIYLDLLEHSLLRLISPPQPIPKASRELLTPRELEVCNMIRWGLSTKEIAVIHGVTEDTVRYHRKNIRRKLGITRTGIHLSNHLLADD